MPPPLALRVDDPNVEHVMACKRSEAVFDDRSLAVAVAVAELIVDYPES